VAETTASDVAAAVADGDADALRRQDSSAHRDDIVAHLLALAPLTVAGPTPIHLSHGLSPLLEAARAAAAVVCLVGGIGLARMSTSAGGGRFAWFLAVLVVFVVCGAYLDIGGRDRRARALALCFWTSAAAFAARGTASLADAWPGSVVVGAVALLRPEAFFGSALWTFARHFPVTARASGIDRLMPVALAVSTTLAVTLFLVNLLPLLQAGWHVWPPLAAVTFNRAAGNPPAFWNLTLGMALPALAVIAIRARLAVPADRRRIRAFMQGVAVSLLLVTLEVVAENLIPPLFQVMNTPVGRYWGGWVIYPPLLLLPAMAVHAVAAGDVLPFRVALRQVLRHVAARWLLSLVALAPCAALVSRIASEQARPIEAILALPGTMMLVWSAAAGVAVLIFRTSLMRATDRWLTGSRGDVAVNLTRLSERLRAARTPLEVAAAVAQSASDVLSCPSTMLVVRAGRLQTTDSIAPPLHLASALPALLDRVGEPCCVAERHTRTYYHMLSDGDRRWIDHTGTTLVLPVSASRAGGGLTAAVALGPRSNALTFTGDDLRFLRAAVSAAALAVTATPPSDAPGEDGEVALECEACGLLSPWAEAPAPCPCGGARGPAAVPLSVAGRFIVTRKLGKGGMGVVYEATDRTLGRRVALKTLTSLSEGPAARLMVEARTMASLAHPHLAVLYGTEQWRQTPVLVMEHFEGGTLAGRLRGSPLPVAEAVSLTGMLCEALAYLHRQGLYHGDIKPSNIGFSSDHHPKFLDFGLTTGFRGREATGVDGRPGPLGGTFAYMPPEVLDGGAAGPALDLWALALMLVECVAGQLPRPAGLRQTYASGLRDALARLDPRDAKCLDAFLARALAPDARRRFRDATAFREGLRALSLAPDQPPDSRDEVA
jgi:hypothetical protein